MSCDVEYTNLRLMGKLIIFSAPSGSGKSTIINHLLQQDLNLAFSISATSRPPRGTERDGVEYFFLTPDEFRERIARGEFLEYEEVYPGRFYGTLKSQVEKQLAAGQTSCSMSMSWEAATSRSITANAPSRYSSSRHPSRSCAFGWSDAAPTPLK